MKCFLLLAFVVLFGIVSYAYADDAQTSKVIVSKQTTLSRNLANDPVAQDILKKIELTKQWIAELEKANYEKLEIKKELEEKRATALENLNRDLKEWDTLWSKYSSRAAFQKFAFDKPSGVKEVFWDAFEYKEMKVKAGKDALKKVIADGGTLLEARSAYNKAAETKKIEIIEANAQFNVKHNLAYYKQQILFDAHGKFVNTSETIGKLNQYYTDYKANPAYLAANPDDKFAYESLGKTNPDTECRKGYVVIYRFHANDYACVTESTAEMWIRLGMGEIQGSALTLQGENAESTKANPLTACKEGYKVLYVLSTKEYSCVMGSTADEWVSQGIATIPDAGQYILDQIKERDARTIAFEINERIKLVNDEMALKEIDLIKHYDTLYKNEEIQSKNTEKLVLLKIQSNSTMTKKEQSDQVMTVRNQHKYYIGKILDDKILALDELRKEADVKVLNIAKEYENNPKIKIVWNYDTSSYEAVENP
ncbi:MAG: hypothetical protein HZA84_08790 [Thaumarchaeota archaeon]|nr:hypothetical protein [Nitrososphaerota archaeon]